MSVKLLLDTDIGSDIDDAVCLAYLLAQPECELLGITTVSGEVERRAMLASALCKVAGRQVPIFPGAKNPLMIAQKQPYSPQADALQKWPHEQQFPRGQAVEFMRQTIHAHPGEITLLGIGPLTNIALLFAMDDEIPSLLKSLVLMCGVFTHHLPGVGLLEWNALLDPHATAIVYRAPVAIHRSIGLDVTTQVTMDARQVQAKFQAPLLQPVLDFAAVWFQNADTITFHDPLAAVTIFDPQICGFERGLVDVELASEKLKGLTYWEPIADGRHEVALTVDRDRFIEHYFAIVQ
ncbi:MAG: nucleoside hydrolase [Herpetosiphonaceae bacterium]|nr:nucleoside hydrolase [Herpetosiphonaceae bacterium]